MKNEGRSVDVVCGRKFAIFQVRVTMFSPFGQHIPPDTNLEVMLALVCSASVSISCHPLKSNAMVVVKILLPVGLLATLP